MIIQVYAVFDNAAKAFGQPLFFHSIGQAARGFGDAVNDPKSRIGAHPADYTLFRIGDYDDETGQLVPAAALENCGNGVTFKEPLASMPLFNREGE